MIGRQNWYSILYIQVIIAIVIGPATASTSTAPTYT